MTEAFTLRRIADRISFTNPDGATDLRFAATRVEAMEGILDRLVDEERERVRATYQATRDGAAVPILRRIRA